LLILGFAIVTSPMLAAEPAGSILETYGLGQVRVPADGADLTVSTQGKGDTAAAAAAESAARMAKVVAALDGFDDALGARQTTSYSVSEDWRRGSDDEEDRKIGYAAANSLRLQVTELPRLGDLIDAALAAGATDVSSPTFTTSREREVRDEALEAAFRAARRDAEVLARSSGGHLGPIVEMSTGQLSQQGASYAEEIVVSGMAPGTFIESPEVQVFLRVAVRWRLLDGASGE
jgi:hypothetical protein